MRVGMKTIEHPCSTRTTTLIATPQSHAVNEPRAVPMTPNSFPISIIAPSATTPRVVHPREKQGVGSLSLSDPHCVQCAAWDGLKCWRGQNRPPKLRPQQPQ